MSLVHRVLILNRPLKIRGFTFMQWFQMLVGLALSFWAFTWVPKEWKVANLPAGFIVGLLMFCGLLVFINGSQMKPGIWWRNLVAYRLKLVPVKFLPHSETSQLYPDPTIVEAPKIEDEMYIR